MRTEDSVKTALTLTEQIEKRGEQGWIEPLIEDMGPWMLLQLGDLANLLEVVLKYNFYPRYFQITPFEFQVLLD